MNEGVRLAALVGSKVCHEIVGPMTGILHGLELLKETEVATRHADAIALLEQGLSKISAKVDFLRSSFAPNEPDSLTPLQEARRLAEPLYASVKPELSWRAPELALPRIALRIFMNLLLLASDCLPKGGVVAVEAADDQTTLEVRAVATGLRATLRAAIGAALRGETSEAELQADVVIPALTHALARSAGYEILTRAAPEKVELVLRLPSPRAA